MLRRFSSVLLQRWGNIHKLNALLDENYITKNSKPPLHTPKIDFQDYNRARQHSKPGKSAFHMTEAPLPAYMDNPTADTFRDLSPEDGLDSNKALQIHTPTLMLRGLHPPEWTTPFQYFPVYFKRIRHPRKGRVFETILYCLVIIGNGKGACGLGLASSTNFRERGPVLRAAIEAAYQNLTVLDVSTPDLLHPINIKFRNVKMAIMPSRPSRLPPHLRRVSELIGIRNLTVHTRPRIKRVTKEASIKTFLYGLQQYHRSAEEIAAARGLVSVGHNKYVEEARAFKGMYTVAPPVNDRQSAADRWKWDLHRAIVMQTPNKDLARETLYKDVELTSDLAQQAGSDIRLQRTVIPDPAVRKAFKDANSGRKVSDYWERNIEKYRMDTRRFAETEKKMREKRRTELTQRRQQQQQQSQNKPEDGNEDEEL